jgi:S-methylmethionine-dependent homocysteine/selenocysteine methylase
VTQVMTARSGARVPLLAGGRFVTDGGIETTLIYREGLELPLFAAFHLYQTPEGTAALERYFRGYASLARRLGTGCVLESATWRSSGDWGARLGYSPSALAAANRKAIDQLVSIRAELETPGSPMVISGCIGPRGDGYVPEQRMSADAAHAYHARQVATFADTEADLVTAITMNYVEEAIGIARAARDAGLPVVVSFTVETDGHLPTGQPLGEAILEVDATTGRAPAYYMINCAHPEHFREALGQGAAWTDRIGGLRANASRKSHAELNEATSLDAGDPLDFGQQHLLVQPLLRNLRVYGGCCGTDERHIEALAGACL